MAREYLYGPVGRHITIEGEVFYGYKSYPTKAAALKEASDARSMGRHARVIPHGRRFVLMISQKGGHKKVK